MNRALGEQAPAKPLPPIGWWILLAAALTLHFALPLGWAAALGLIVFVAVQRARPLEFMSSYLLVLAGASLINYGRGFLTFELSILTGGILFMLFCYGVETRGRAVTIQHSPFTVPVLLYLGLSIVNFGRGLLVGNSARYAGLELIAALAIASTLLVSNHTVNQKFVRAINIWLWVLCLVHTTLGVWSYAVLHVRTGSIYFTPVPGVVFALMFNFALRARSMTRALIGLLLLTPLLLHQFLSFTRGYWMALIGSTLFSILMYTGRGTGVAARWRRAGTGLLFLAGLGAVAGATVALTLGMGDIFEAAGSRFNSSAGTEMSWETGSNIVRLSEYFHVLDYVIESPVFGKGLGFFFTVREPIGYRLLEQWFVHQNYLLVTLKQGLIGLALFIWMLIGALRTGLNGRKLPEDWQRAWCLGAAAVTVWLVIYSMVHFPLAEVNTIFTSALVWGIAMALTSSGQTVLRWRSASREGAE